MARIIFICSLCIGLLTSLTGQNPSSSIGVREDKLILKVDALLENSVDLDGEWEVYWDTLLKPESFIGDTLQA